MLQGSGYVSGAHCCLIVVANGQGNKQQAVFFADAGFDAKRIPAVESPDIHANKGKTGAADFLQ